MLIDGNFSGWQKNYVESAKPTFKNNSVDSGRNISEDYTGGDDVTRHVLSTYMTAI
jgi:hypothetical protein